MKQIKRLSSAIKAIGVVALILSVVMFLYQFVTNTQWTEMKEKLSSSGVSCGIDTRLQFDRDYYSAMSAAVNTQGTTNQATNAALPYFSGYSDKIAEGDKKTTQKSADEALIWFTTEFDPSTYSASIENREKALELRGLKEIYDAIDGFKTANMKKKLPKKAASDTPEYFEGYFNTASSTENITGESYYEFMQAVKAMMTEYVDGGNALTDPKKWMDEVFTWEDYAVKLNDVLTAEKAEMGDNFLDFFIEKATEENADISTALKEAYDIHAPQYSYEQFVIAAKTCLNSQSFTGDYKEIDEAVDELNANSQSKQFESWLNTFARSVAETALQRKSIALIGVLWLMVANSGIFLITGIALIILSAVVNKVLQKILIKRSKVSGFHEDESDILLRVNHLKQYFKNGDGVTKAVDDVSFYIKKGEVFGLVGESGCGKTTTGRTIINLYDPTEGDVYFEGFRISSSLNGLPVLIKELKKDAESRINALKDDTKRKCAAEPQKASEYKKELKTKTAEIKKELSKKIGLAQEQALESEAEKSKSITNYREKRKEELTKAYEHDKQSLSGNALLEREKQYKMELKVAAKDNINTKMQMVFQDPIASINPRMTVREIIAEGLRIRGIRDQKYIDEKVYEMLELVGLVREHADRYPHEFSGGQRQRIGIARAIVLEPDLIIADEPISALDVSIQAQVINLMNELREKRGLTIMFIAHNLSVVKYFSDRIGVMYFGKLVEMTTSEELFKHPLHPYTKSLLSAIPYPDPHHEKTRKRIEYNPTLAHDYSKEKPTLKEITPGHFILCNTEEFTKYQEELSK